MGLTKRDLEEIGAIVEAKTKKLLEGEYLQGVIERAIKNVTDKYDRMISELHMEMEILKNCNSQLSSELDNLEQYSRLKNLRFFGVAETENESLNATITRIVGERMQVKNFNEAMIKKCHRVPNKNTDTNNGKPSCVLVRFSDVAARNKVLGNRRFLKSSGISVQEDLTKRRVLWMKTALENFSRKEVWSFNGNIFVKTDNIVHRIKDESHLKELCGNQQGPLAMGVPGELKGYWAAHKKFGKLPWKQLVEPSIELCEQGYNMSNHQYHSLKMRRIKEDPNFRIVFLSREWFFNEDGSHKKPGDNIKPRILCETLRVIATNGADDFYEGLISKIFLEDIRGAGGILSDGDLKTYQ
ncbi:unnamed protein product [Phaedon cochleariae]|uniref:Uncharacterized protein n=1 Tax=Phaedon cochleariae TaxID=80249 RepID=A0A9N9S8E4_PHACE|nr:unnamed protein product [Phaedon cochleariae]